MAKNTFLSFSTTAGDNTDVGGIGILGTNSVSNFDNAFRTLMAILRGDLDNGTVFVTKSGAYTAVANDNNAFYEFTAAATLTLTAAATLGADWHMMVFANGGVVTVDPDAAELINGASTLTIASGDAAYIICTGSAFKAITFPSIANVTAKYATKSANYTAVAADNVAVHRFTAAATLSLTAAATLGLNWSYTVIADGGTVTIDPNGSETINGVSSLVLETGTMAKIWCDGTQFIACKVNLALVGTTDNAIVRFDGTNGKIQNSAATVDDSGNLSVVKVTATGDIETTGNILAGDASFVGGARIEAQLASGFVSGFEYTGADGLGACIGTNRTSSDGSFAIWYRGGSQVGSVTTSGGATSYNTTSDYRTKDKIEPYSGGLEAVLSLNPRSFIMKMDPEERRHVGFIAHEVQSVAPQAVTGEMDAVDDDGNMIIQQFDATKLIPLLVSAVQELKAELDLLRREGGR